MKKYLFIFLGAVTALFSSCLQDSGEYYSPSLAIKNLAIVNKDSVIMKQDATGEIYFDSLHVKDTVFIQITANAYANNLTRLNIIPSDTSVVNVILPDSLDRAFKLTSDFKNGKFDVKDNIRALRYPLQFVPKKESANTYFIISVTSDVTKVQNETALKIKFPIKKRRI